MLSIIGDAAAARSQAAASVVTAATFNRASLALPPAQVSEASVVLLTFELWKSICSVPLAPSVEAPAITTMAGEPKAVAPVRSPVTFTTAVSACAPAPKAAVLEPNETVVTPPPAQTESLALIPAPDAAPD